MLDPIGSLRHVLDLAELGDKVSRKIRNLRIQRTGESDLDAFNRVVAIAQKVICHFCNGHGHVRGFADETCRHCLGTGEMAYDPVTPAVARIQES